MAMNYATTNGSLAICRYLVEELDFDIDSFLDHCEDCRSHTTPFYYAARHGHLEVCKYLFEKGPKVDFDDTLLRTARVSILAVFISLRRKVI